MYTAEATVNRDELNAAIQPQIKIQDQSRPVRGRKRTRKLNGTKIYCNYWLEGKEWRILQLGDLCAPQ